MLSIFSTDFWNENSGQMALVAIALMFGMLVYQHLERNDEGEQEKQRAIEACLELQDRHFCESRIEERHEHCMYRNYRTGGRYSTKHFDRQGYQRCVSPVGLH
jgi:hypothetical protein